MADAMGRVRTVAVTVDAHVQGADLPLAVIAQTVVRCAGMHVVRQSDEPDLVIFVRVAGAGHQNLHPAPGESPLSYVGRYQTPGAEVHGEVWLQFAQGGRYAMSYETSVPAAYRDERSADPAFDEALRSFGGYVSTLVNLFARTHGSAAMQGLLAAGDWGLRSQAAMRLALMGDTDCAPLIVPLLDDQDRHVRECAESALRVLNSDWLGPSGQT